MKIRSNWKWILVYRKIESLTTKNQLQFYFTFKLFPPQKISLFTHSHHSRQAQAGGRRELSPVKPRSSPRPTTPPIWSHRSNPSPIWLRRLSFSVSPMNPVKPTPISPHPSPQPTASPLCLQAPLPVKVVSHLLHLRPLSHSSDPSFFHPHHHCLKFFFFYYCKITFLLGFWRIGGWGDSWVSVVVGWGWV